MDFINKSFAQLSELFQSMTIGARVTSALLLVVAVVSLGYLFNNRISSSDSDLMQGMPIPASLLPAMEAAFYKAKLTGYEIRGTQIRVPVGQRANYMAALAEAKALPPNFGSYIRQSLDASNPFEDRKTKEARIKGATQDELANVISRMSGIEAASVMYDIDIKPNLAREKITTATVSVKPQGETQLDDSKVSSIRHLVAGAIAGMKSENVTVADLNGRVYPGTTSDGGNAEDNLYVQSKRIHEQDLKRKIINALASIPNVNVEALVDLDRELGSSVRKIAHNPKPVTVSVSEKNTLRSREGAAPGGRPGYAANQANAALALPASGQGGSREEEENSQSDVRSVVSGEQTDKRMLGLTPKLARVSVGIPSSYFEKVWHERNDVAGSPPKTPDKAALDVVCQEESSKIQKHVAALLPPPADGAVNVTDLVTVTSFQEMKMPEIPATPTSRQVMEWLNRYWTTLGMIGLVMFSLVMLRSMVRSLPSAPAEQMAMAPRLSEARAKGQGEAAPEAEPAKVSYQNRLKRTPSSGRSLREDLTEVVREDPDVAANILKAWIGNRG